MSRSQRVAVLSLHKGEFVSAVEVTGIFTRQILEIKEDELVRERLHLLTALSDWKRNSFYELRYIFLPHHDQEILRQLRLPTGQRKDFFLYVDEFQNYAIESFVTFLAESRKYRLNLILANQFLAQVPKIFHALLGNVGTFVIFRVGPPDASLLEQVVHPQFNGEDLINLPNFQAISSLLYQGTKIPPFNLQEARWDPGNKGDESAIRKITSLSRKKYAASRETVDKFIRKRAKEVEEEEGFW